MSIDHLLIEKVSISEIMIHYLLLQRTQEMLLLAEMLRLNVQVMLITVKQHLMAQVHQVKYGYLTITVHQSWVLLLLGYYLWARYCAIIQVVTASLTERLLLLQKIILRFVCVYLCTLSRTLIHNKLIDTVLISFILITKSISYFITEFIILSRF